MIKIKHILIWFIDSIHRYLLKRYEDIVLYKGFRCMVMGAAFFKALNYKDFKYLWAGQMHYIKWNSTQQQWYYWDIYIYIIYRNTWVNIKRFTTEKKYVKGYLL